MCIRDRFSTADDNQSAVTIKVAQGERELFTYNKALGEFNLEGIAPAKRGMPQIEVTLDIDANGILSVSAKDKMTGKENKITIKANSGLTETEIQEMVKDAEINAEADQKARTLIEARNNAEGALRGFTQDLEKYGDKVTAEQKTAAEDAIKVLEDAAAGTDATLIQDTIPKLYEAMGPITAVKQEAEAAPAEPAKTEAPTDDNVTDVEFKENKNV